VSQDLVDRTDDQKCTPDAEQSDCLRRRPASFATVKTDKDTNSTAINSANPKKSNSFTCCLNVIPLWGLRLRKKNKMIPATPPVGKLIQKHHLQDTWSVNTPPRRGPTTLAIPHVAPIKPPYLPRSRKETMSDMTIITSCMRPPPPIPWTARQIMSQVKLFAAPQSAEPNYRYYRVRARMRGRVYYFISETHQE